MVVRRDGKTIKKAARIALSFASAIYVSGEDHCTSEVALKEVKVESGVPIFSSQTFVVMVEKIQEQLERSRKTKLCNAAS
jgi:hypothetical protein